MKTTRFWHDLLVGLILLGSIAPARGENGVTDNAIKIGIVNDMSGPDKDVVSERMRGATIALKSAGEISGRKLEILRLDDKYDPKLTLEKTRELLEKEKVFALFGFNGTPQVKAVMPLLDRENIPFITPFTAADVLRTPFNRNIFPGRAAASEEAEVAVKYLAEDLGIKQISLLVQDDAFGEGGRLAVSQALEKRGLRVAQVAKYKRENLDMTAAVRELTSAKAIVLFSIQSATIAFLKKWQESGSPGTILVAGSAVEANAAITQSGKAADGLVLTNSIPSLDNSSVSIVKSFKDAMSAAKETSVNAHSLEGFIVANIFVEGLKRAGKDLSRNSLRAALEKMNPASIGGLEVSYSAENHRGLSHVYLTKIQNGQITALK